MHIQQPLAKNRKDSEDKENENQDQQKPNILKKLMRIDKRHSNFELIDELQSKSLKVKCFSENEYPINDYTLNGYWKHIKELYFKAIEHDEIARIKYFDEMVKSKILNTYKIYLNPSAEEEISDILKREYFSNGWNGVQESQLNYENLIKHIYVQYCYLHADKQNKKLVKKLYNFIKGKNRILPRKKGDLMQTQLERQEEELYFAIEMIREEEQEQKKPITTKYSAFHIGQEDQVQKELEDQISKLQQINQQNKDNLLNLKKLINNQIRNQTKGSYTFLQSTISADLQKKYLRTQILKLDKYQVAESICKILESQKRNREYYFLIQFQEGINLEPAWFSQKEFLELNRIREKDSLIKIYNVSMKSRFSRVSQNFYAIGLLQKKAPSEIPQNKLIEKMKEKGKQAKPIMDFFDSFEMCHHCKQFFKKHSMFKCDYQSARVGLPNPSYSYHNSYIFQIIDNIKEQGDLRKDSNVNKEAKNLNNFKFINRMENSFVRYTPKGTQMICNRKYCKMCIKNYYPNLEDNGLCPFCQMVCSCSRCTRNAITYKLKSNYSELGGDMYQLDQLSAFEAQVRLSNKNIQITSYNTNLRNTNNNNGSNSHNNNSSTNSGNNHYHTVNQSNKFTEDIPFERKRGRPAKKIKKDSQQDDINKLNKFRTYTKLKIFKRKMSHLNQLLQLVQTREKRKFSLLRYRHQLFHKRVDLVDPQQLLLRNRKVDFFEEFFKNHQENPNQMY